MLSKINNIPEATCMLVEVIAKKSQNIPWQISLDGEPICHKKIRRVSIDKFYELVTGEKEGFKQLIEVLPKVMDDVLENIKQSGIENRYSKNCKKIGWKISLKKFIFTISLKRYEGIWRI